MDAATVAHRLPPSLTELRIDNLSDHALPALPSQLEVLAIGGSFNQPLTRVLPADLRVLRLTGDFNQLLSSDVFTSTPQLHELHLYGHSVRVLFASELPRSLRVVRLGRRCVQGSGRGFERREGGVKMLT